MPKQRSPDSYKAEEMYKQGMKLVEIASQLNVSEGTVRSWKNRYNFDGKSNATLQKNKRNVAKKKRGGQPGNKNAVGHGAPKGNQNAVKHGLFSRYLPEDTREIFFSLDSADPLDLLWDQLKLAYTAIMRAQMIMHVRDRSDKTKEIVDGITCDVQQAWDKQASFLQAQAKAQKELTTMIKQYEELLHKNWNLATKEQKARIKQMKANTERLRRDSSPEDDEGVEIINDVEKEETDKDIGTDNPEVSASV